MNRPENNEKGRSTVAENRIFEPEFSGRMKLNPHFKAHRLSERLSALDFL